MSKEVELLYEAYHSEYGIEVEMEGNFQVTLQRLYAARRKDIDLEVLQFCRSPHSATHIWIVKNPNNSSGYTTPSPFVNSPSQIKPNPQGDGELYSLADMFGDD